MRLEFLFAQAAHHLRGKNQWDSRCAMSALLEIMSIFGRSDLKNEAMKELERHQASLGQLRQNPAVDQNRLVQIIRELDKQTKLLHKSKGPVAASLKTNDFLTCIQQRGAIPGGTCDFDLPVYHNWLQQPPERRMKDLSSWLGQFELIANAIQLILQLLRESSPLKAAIAKNGFYQMNMDPSQPGQLVRIAVKRDLPCFAEISGGRHRFTARFMVNSASEGCTRQTTHDVPFEISCCLI